MSGCVSAVSDCKDRRDAYAVITERIVEQLERGVIPWDRPWKSVSGDGPMSLSTMRPYRGVNVLLLGCAAMAKGYTSPFWTTFKQAKERGGSVRKGEKATPVVLWKPVPRKPEEGSDDDPGSYLLLRYYSVFNVEQCDGLDVPALEPLPPFDPIERAETVLGSMRARPTVKHGGDRAYYSPNLDYVQMPIPQSFEAPDAYYAVLAHELVHSTGHASRLNRKGIEASAPFGSETYSREELVAEIGSAFVMSHCGIDPNIPRSAAYVASWLKALRDDRRMIATAAAQAAKASDWIVGTEAA